jgi:hypothetical protein
MKIKEYSYEGQILIQDAAREWRTGGEGECDCTGSRVDGFCSLRVPRVLHQSMRRY